MKARVAALSPRARIAVTVAAVLVYALVLWFLLVAPKRSQAASLQADIAAAQQQLAQARGSTARPARSTAPVADVVRLAKAMPSSADQASLVLELSRLARDAQVSISSIAPAEPTTDGAGATLVPVTVTITGTFRQVTRFLRDARALVSFRGGKLAATGRLFTVKSVELSESSSGKFPLLDATITFDAYAYDGPIVPPAPPTPPPSQDGTSTSGATASGATP